MPVPLPKWSEVPLPDGDRGYIYAPYIPVLFIDCRPWYRAIWGLAWWRQLWAKIVNPWRRRRGWKMRYAKKVVNQSRYYMVPVAEVELAVIRELEDILNRSVKGVVESDRTKCPHPPVPDQPIDTGPSPDHRVCIRCGEPLCKVCGECSVWGHDDYNHELKT